MGDPQHPRFVVVQCSYRHSVAQRRERVGVNNENNTLRKVETLEKRRTSIAARARAFRGESRHASVEAVRETVVALER